MVHPLLLDRDAVEAVLAVDELNDITKGIPHRPVVMRLRIFECFDKSPLNVTRLGCLDSGINQTFSTSHGMEEELRRSQTTEI